MVDPFLHGSDSFPEPEAVMRSHRITHRDHARRQQFRPLLETLEDRAVPAVAFALSNNSLIAFDTAVPGAAAAPVAVTGLNAGDNLVGIDIRPQNGFLYGLGFNTGAGTVQLYSVSSRTGQATAIGTTGTFVSAGGTPVPIMGTNF